MNSLLLTLNQQLNDNSVLLPCLLAFSGGVVSSISPCTVGLLPVVVGYVAGYTKDNIKKISIQLLFFIIGLSFLLSIAGIVAAAAGKAFGYHAGEIWVLLMASLILIMGLNLLNILEIPMPVFLKKFPTGRSGSLIIYPFTAGAAFALATTPCSTPMLAGILAYASLKANLSLGFLLLFLYSLGQGVVILAAGIFTSLFGKILTFRKYSGILVKIGGIVLILASFYMYLTVFEVI